LKDDLFESLEALSFKGVCFVIGFRFESLEALSFKGTWGVPSVCLGCA